MNVKNDYDVFISYRHDTGFYMAQLLYSKLVNSYSPHYAIYRDEFEFLWNKSEKL
jgi:hypothetical protein